MRKIQKLKTLAAEEIKPAAPSWAIVYYLLIKNDSDANANLGEIVAASGESSIFSYARESVEPMYYSTIGGIQRLKILTGYSVNSLRTVDAEKAFRFIQDGIDAGKGIFMAGPEIGICYGYDDSETVEERKTYGYARWGPAFNGTILWDRFSKYVEMFGEAEGFAYLMTNEKPESTEVILDTICTTVVDWQNEHPATKYGMQQKNYGLAAFKKFIADIRNPELRSQVDKAYINCHVIQLQTGGRYWLSLYIKQLAQELSGDLKRHVESIGDLFMTVYSQLKRFIEFDITSLKNESDIQMAIDQLEEAYHSDEIILEKFISLRQAMQS